MNRFVGRILGLLMLGFLPFATAAEAQSTEPQLPLRLKNCQPLGKAPNGDASYNRCFDYDPRTEYGQVYVSFRMEDFDFDSFAQTLDRQRRRSLVRRVAELFVNDATQGHVFVTLTLVPGDGTPPVKIGTIPLASFSRTDRNGITFNRSGLTLDGFYGPAFLATAQTQVFAEIHYTFTEDQTSQVALALARASTFFSGLGLLTSKAVSGPRLQEAFSPIDRLISTQFDTRGTQINPVQLSFDPSSTMAAYRHLTFNGIATNGGHLYIGLAKLRSVLVNPPAADSAIVYAPGGYGPNATDQILDRRIDGITLRMHIREAMGADYEKLTEPLNAARFLDGNRTLGRVIDDSELGLNPDDKLALRWALLASNPLLTSREVRATYLLSSSEARLAELKLPLPPIVVRLTEMQTLLVETARASADDARGTSDLVNESIRLGSDALRAASLPTRPEGFARIPELNTPTQVTSGGVIPPPNFVYLGETPSQEEGFNGHITYSNGAEYTGSFMYSEYAGLANGSVIPILHGYGRYVGGSEDVGLRDYSGEFANSYFSGSGIMRWSDGREFHGRFANDKPNGYGILYDPDGTMYYARFLAGERAGDAIRKRPSSQELEAGRWRNNGTFLKND